jgi:hypothetical protein
MNVDSVQSSCNDHRNRPTTPSIEGQEAIGYFWKIEGGEEIENSRQKTEFITRMEEKYHTDPASVIKS